MIYTVTLNPSIDYIVHVTDFKPGTVNRMTKDFKFPGGKGINVSRILKRLDISSSALGFLGGFTGTFIREALEKEGLPCDFTPINEDSRINIKLKSQAETEINGAGPNITNEEIQALKEKLSQVTKEDIVIFSGSTPATLRKGFYQELIQIIKDKEAEFVIDTTGDALTEAFSAAPLLIKPNNHELSALYGVELNTIDEIIPYGKKLLAKGPRYVLISMAGDGALLFTNDGVYQSNVLKRTVKNSVGAGDSMIAGFVGGFAKTKDPIEAFRWGVACGSGTAFSDDLASREMIDSLLPEVEIKQIED
ncbi:1-phosphofructokinase [Enterococcus asini]|uniref:1-phosphofructokinase n=1 Tax=Enterococcus asini TaxID=57732 RepID=UPI002890992D|nr:1-phosphofructokinase [Enterococcus asini]MDT2757019.1 1-phosphofructokinase [Enterococcus asini]